MGPRQTTTRRFANMAEVEVPVEEVVEGGWGEEAVEEVAGDIVAADVKLFNRWTLNDVEIKDISLVDYLAVKSKPTYVPHTAGRYASKRFRKANCPVVERVVNSLMMHGRNNGKKMMAVRIVKHAFEIIHLLSGEN